jgi:hypothetical protein
MHENLNISKAGYHHIVTRREEFMALNFLCLLIFGLLMTISSSICKATSNKMFNGQSYLLERFVAGLVAPDVSRDATMVKEYKILLGLLELLDRTRRRHHVPSSDIASILKDLNPLLHRCRNGGKTS